MARKSRRAQQTEQIGKTENTHPEEIKVVNRTALYVRLSLCDDFRYQREDSIQSQICILKDYLAKHPELHLVKEYIDRGWSGTDFQRPAFLQMIEDIQSGKINCIVVKDLSRFGRSYWETGYFLEVLLPQLKTRFISIADSFDSSISDPGTLAIILKNIMNDFYSRDISRRMSDTIDVKRSQGVYVTKQPYGYMVDPDNPPYMTFDPELYHYTRLIFDWALEGISVYAITKRLSAMKIPTTQTIRRLRTGRKSKCRDNKLWNHKTVAGILRNPTYTGDFVCGKAMNRKCDPYRSRTKIPQEDWIVIPNSHPAYITHEEYDQINQRLSEDSAPTRTPLQTAPGKCMDNINYYKDKLICAICGRKMFFISKYSASYTDRFDYICYYDGIEKESLHKNVRIRKQFLDLLVLHQIQEQCLLAEELATWLRSPDGKQITQRLISESQAALNQASQRLEELKAKRAALFEKQTDFLLDLDTFTSEMSILRKELREVSITMEEHAKQLSKRETSLTFDNPWLKLFSKMPYPEKMSTELSEMSIVSISVHNSDDITVHVFHQEWFTSLWNTYQENRNAKNKQ